MNSLESIIKDRFAQISKYLNMINKYFDRVKIVIEGTNIDEYRRIVSMIEYINNFITTDINISGLTADNPAAKIMAINTLWNDLQKLYDSMDEFNRTLLAEKYSEKVIFTMSQSGGMEFKLLRAGIFNAHDRIMNEVRGSDDKFFSEVLPTLDRGTCIEFLLNNDTINSFTTQLMFYLMKTGNESERMRLKKLIEARKDSILHVSRKKFGNNGNSIEDMPLLYGLVPACQVMPLDVLLKEIGFPNGMIDNIIKKEYRMSRSSNDNVVHMVPQNHVEQSRRIVPINKTSFIDVLHKISENSRGKIGFVVLNRGSKSIIEFDIRGLISPSYVTPLVTDPSFGLNKKFIKRFSTVTHYDEIPGDDILSIIPNNAKYLYIIDLFGDTIGRILSPELGKYKTPIGYVPGFTVGISTRPHQYNEILSNKIIGDCIDPLAEGIISTLGEIKSGKSSEAIKNKIINAFLEHYDVVKPTTYDDFKALFTSWDALDNVLINAMMHIVHKQPTQEMLLTYLVKIDDVSKMFNSELELAFKDAKVPTDMFVQLNKVDLTTQLREITKQVVTIATNQLDQGNQWTKHSLSLKEHFIDKKFENI